MVFVMALGLHGLLMLTFAWMVGTGRSKLRWTHLAYALLLPFIGECCLVAAELGRVPDQPIYMNSLHPDHTLRHAVDRAQVPENWKDVLNGDETIARQFLLNIINHQPETYSEMLHAALQSKNSEVCHIAAAAMMKMHHQYEETIRRAAETHERMPGDIISLSVWIDAIGVYRSSGLAQGAAYVELIREEAALIEEYLVRMPLDTQRTSELVRIHLTLGNQDQAWQRAKQLLEMSSEQPEHWDLAINVLENAKRADEATLLRREKERAMNRFVYCSFTEASNAGTGNHE